MNAPLERTQIEAQALDQKDALSSFRQKFHLPLDSQGHALRYFAGHSLGLCPRGCESRVLEELRTWAELAVGGHLAAKYPWLAYHESVAPALARMVGAQESEVVAMNGLTANLHLMLVSFYRPTAKRYKILIENNTFPSDKYAVHSQARFHGFDPEQAVVELEPDQDMTVTHERVLQTIDQHRDSLALVMLGNCNYLSGQCFDMEAIVQQAKSVGAMVGFNLAHGAGNLWLKLHQWEPDFAVWCSYKYLNAGPGGIACAFVHQRHHGQRKLPRFEGWWGSNKERRFEMGPRFESIPTAEGWQLSNPPILQLAVLRSSLELFDLATMQALVIKRDGLTTYLEQLLRPVCRGRWQVMTPPLQAGGQSRGAMLALRFNGNCQDLAQKLKAQGIVVDFRQPNIIRMAPAPLYNTYCDVYHLVQAIDQVAC